MNPLVFILVVFAVFLTVLFIGVISQQHIEGKDTGATISDSCALGTDISNALPSENQYDNFDNILKIIDEKYTSSYKPGGQVY